MSTHKDDAKARITAVTQTLLNDHIMVGVVTSNLDAYVSRLQRTLDEVCLCYYTLALIGRQLLSPVGLKML